MSTSWPSIGLEKQFPCKNQIEKMCLVLVDNFSEQPVEVWVLWIWSLSNANVFTRVPRLRTVHLGIVGSIIVTRKVRKARRCSRWWGRDRGWRRRGTASFWWRTCSGGTCWASWAAWRLRCPTTRRSSARSHWSPCTGSGAATGTSSHPSSGTGQTSRRGALWLLLY